MSFIQKVDAAQFKAEQAKGTLLLLDFYADWCGPCKAMVPALEDIAAEYSEEVTVLKIDVDAEPELKESFGVRGIPTLVLMRGEKIVSQVSGAQTRSALAAMIEGAA